MILTRSVNTSSEVPVLLDTNIRMLGKVKKCSFKLSCQISKDMRILTCTIFFESVLHFCSFLGLIRLDLYSICRKACQSG